MDTVQFKLSLDSLGGDLPAKSLEETEFEKIAIVSSDLSRVEDMWLAPSQYDISTQLKELLTNNMLIALFPNLPYAYQFPFLQHQRNEFLRHEINKESPS